MTAGRRRSASRRRQRGAVGGLEALPFGFLMFVAVTLVVTNAWAVVDSKMAVNAAAREAVRAYVEAPEADGAAARAAARAQETLASYGRADADRLTVGDPVTDRGYVRCARASITIEYRVPALTVPFIGGFGSAVTARATHSELIDPYRSGLPEGGCL